MTEQDPLAAPDATLVDPLSDAALAAMLAEPYEAGLSSALDDGVAAALPVVSRELAYLDRAVAATQGRLAGLAAAPVAGMPAAVQAPAVASDEAAPVVAAVPASGAPPSGLGAIAAAGARLLPVDRAAARVAVLPSAPAAAAAPADGETGPGFGRLDWGGVDWDGVDWGGVDWGRLAAPPAIAAPAAPVPESVEQVAASPMSGAVERAGWPAWSAAPSDAMAIPSAAPDASVMASAADGGFGGFAGRQETAMPVQAPRGDAGETGARETGAREAGAEEAADSESGGIGGVLEVDGALLGRFIAEQLGRAADRPPSGMTGFDPLVSPAWMSASVG